MRVKVELILEVVWIGQLNGSGATWSQPQNRSSGKSEGSMVFLSIRALCSGHALRAQSFLSQDGADMGFFLKDTMTAESTSE